MFEEKLKLLARFYHCESGATVIEYGLIVTFIAVAIVGAAGNLGTSVSNVFSAIAGYLPKAAS